MREKKNEFLFHFCKKVSSILQKKMNTNKIKEVDNRLIKKIK